MISVAVIPTKHLDAPYSSAMASPCPLAEAVKRQLARKRVALIIAECGSGKTKIGSTALGALHGLWADQKRKGGRKSFGIVMCPSHVTQKWVREIGETLPDTAIQLRYLSICCCSVWS